MSPEGQFQCPSCRKVRKPPCTLVPLELRAVDPAFKYLPALLSYQIMMSTSKWESVRNRLPLEGNLSQKRKRLRVNLESAPQMPPSKVTLDDEVDDLDGISSSSLVSRPVGLMPAS